MNEAVATTCPYCAEPVEVYVDPDGGSRQAFVEDCPVCCLPWEVEIVQHPSGDWSVELRTADE